MKKDLKNFIFNYDLNRSDIILLITIFQLDFFQNNYMPNPKLIKMTNLNIRTLKRSIAHLKNLNIITISFINSKRHIFINFNTPILNDLDW